jgi:threonine synthase
MDVGDPSNLERIRWMAGGSVAGVRAAMTATAHGDEQIRDAMRELDTRYGYTADPHTAIGYLGARHCLDLAPGSQVLLLATAHPAKFGDVVESAIGRPIGIPTPLADAMRRPRLVEHISGDLDALTPLL